MKAILIAITLLFSASAAWACSGPPAYVGCTGDQLRQWQAAQFRARNSGSQLAQTKQYWRDRQYMDRIRNEQRVEDRWHAKVEAQTRVEVAKQQRRAWRGYYRPRTVYVSSEWHDRYPTPKQPIETTPEPAPRPVVRRSVPSAIR